MRSVARRQIKALTLIVLMLLSTTVNYNGNQILDPIGVLDAGEKSMLLDQLMYRYGVLVTNGNTPEHLTQPNWLLTPELKQMLEKLLVIQLLKCYLLPNKMLAALRPWFTR